MTENNNHSQQIVSKLWNYYNVLRDDGMSYGDYVEQLTYLLFLKMADERTKPPFNKPQTIPKKYGWDTLLARDGDELEVHYRHLLEELGKLKGMLGIIFRKAQNKIQDPAKLRRLIVDLIDKERWLTLDADVKGDAYEGLLQKNAEDVKSGAGQYFTPRPLIDGIVDCMQPQADETICDPACGTGGFLLSAHSYISRHNKLDPDQKKHLKHDALRGTEIVDNTARLCVMNLYPDFSARMLSSRNPNYFGFWMMKVDALRSHRPDLVSFRLQGPGVCGKESLKVSPLAE